MNSLRTRLISLIIMTIAIVWIATAFSVWKEAKIELNELIDHLPVAVRAEIEHERSEIIGEIAGHLAKPVLVAFPLLVLLLLFVVNLALRPLRRLANEVAIRAPDHLEPLLIQGAPSEVQPLIGKLNHLFAAISRALDNERRFTADAAHELRTPLAALKAQAQVAQAATEDTVVREHALRKIIAGCDRATQLTEQLLLLARLDALDGRVLKPVMLHQLVPGVLADLAGFAIAYGSTIEWVEETQSVVQGDEALLTVLIRNLVNNALRHNPPGTHVRVLLTQEKTKPVIKISDNGPGIQEADPMCLMQRFRRGENNTSEGSGLGLSIVQRIAELHGATFLLTSTSGTPEASGTTASLAWD